MIRRLLLALVAVSLLCGQAMAAEKFIVATDCTWPPMEMLDANKQPIGFDVDFITAVGKAAGFEVDVRNIAWDGIFGGVATGQYDIVAAATTITEERQKQFDFSDPYYEVAQAVVLPAGKSIKSLADLKGKKVGGQIGTTGVFVIRKAGVTVDLKEYDDVGLAIQDMLGGRLDAVICDDPVALYYVNKKADTAGKLNISFKTEEKEYYGFTVRKGRKDLVEKLNKGIKDVKASGVEAQLLQKWMGASK
ncbi:ABC transporter arginine-binding protein 1 [bioreactor metagenome]|uniref:Extracellular solute-binding protein family 3 n=3 Tax=root TaxID=1 RepID=A0A212KAF9_9BACT|nr:basic amino acid ABC transporter substrate-binding protein [Desulfovibrio desulfuricans]MCB6543149.1 basic amino acid ABC transporter substrate-binding protein [Desulfovibrio desulfuricans]MCB6554262.1 basic amino acid ABC transporter substrate-binding protein [Desulfovibrio desulfuricans]MCB6564929.1 basic amino acid ABC transporter substrate-binding protein [Desulfovibrio desulfuricans]MCB7347268.1 basic amino acid ABC transporter substrate-binding protein [Desulfovibrio desulfuricans]MCQ